MCCVVTFTVNGMAMNRFGEVIDLVGDDVILNIRRYEPLVMRRNVLKKMRYDYLEPAVLWRSWILPSKDLLEAMPKAFHIAPWVIFRACTK